MNRTEAITRLRDHAADLRARGATGLWLFGSTLRDEAGPDSDIDLFLDYDPSQAFSLVDLAGIEQYLGDALGVAVDLTTRDSLHPRLRDAIEQDAEQVF